MTEYFSLAFQIEINSSQQISTADGRIEKKNPFLYSFSPAIHVNNKLRKIHLRN